MSLSRQLRRAAERKQLKDERKAFRSASQENDLKDFPILPVTDLSAVQEAEASDEIDTCAPVCHDVFSPDCSTNESQSTRDGAGGPRTPEGKAASCLNNLKHGLAGKFRVLAGESQSDFDTAHEALIAEHQPTTPTESELVRRMAEHAWLSRRAQDLVDKAVMDCNTALLSLFLRYQTSNDRGFRACLNDLLRLHREQRKTNREFESQNRELERHDARVRLANARAGHLELDTDIRSCVDAPIPGYSSVPVEQIKELFKTAMLALQPLRKGKAAA